MIDWPTVFESAHPKKGASETEVAAFVAGLGLPADRPIPPSYLSFVRYSDGGHFQNGDRLFRMWGTPEHHLPHGLPEFMPLAVPFAFTGSNGLYLFDMRERPDANGEYPIIYASAGNATFDPNTAPRVADSFEEICRGRSDIERLQNSGIILTAEQWDVWTDPKPMLDDCTGDRKLRLFACACARHVWDQMPDQLFRDAVELAERYADTDLTLDAESEDLPERCETWRHNPAWNAAAAAANNCLVASAARAAQYGASAAARAEAGKGGGLRRYVAVRAKQADLLREIFGNPLRPPVCVEPEWLAWNGRMVPQIAERIYQTRVFGDLPILADALEDAGCTNAELFTHLRDTREHVRGCWALDLLRDAPI